MAVIDAGAVYLGDAVSAPAVVRCDQVAVRFGPVRALAGVSTSIPAGRVHGLLGPNGAGKTTLLRALLGLVRPDSGTVDVLGHDPTLATGTAPGGVAGWVDTPRFYPYLSATRNLALLAAMDDRADLDPATRIPELLERVGLADRGRQKVAGYSTGQRQRLGLAAALMRDPALLIVDEPTTGLDPAGVRDLHGVITSLVADGGSVLLSSHDMGEVELLCGSVTVLDHGSVAFDGTLASLRDQAPDPTHRLATADDDGAAALLAGRPGVQVERLGDGALLVRAAQPTLDAAVLALGAAGIAVRGLEREDSALEAMFLRLVSG